MSRIDYDLSLIKAFVFDIDGVLSPSTIPLFPGQGPTRMVNVKDGYAMQFAVKSGYPIAITKYISPIQGGYGCARDVIEQILKAQNHWMQDEKAFGW